MATPKIHDLRAQHTVPLRANKNGMYFITPGEDDRFMVGALRAFKIWNLYIPSQLAIKVVSLSLFEVAEVVRRDRASIRNA